MPVVSICPSGEELKQFARGTLEAASAERVICHLQRCRACLATLEGAPIEDTLIEALKTWGGTVGGDKVAVEGLIQRLKKLAVGAAPDPELTEAEAPAAKSERLDFLSPPQGEGEIGRLGGYRILQVLGAGGMGVVLAAEDVRLKRKVALKVMKAELAANEGAKMRFLREAETCAAVRSDHVVTIYQVGEQGDAPFLAMEYLEGMSLDDWLKKGRKPSLAQTARIGRQIALGLAAAHERGLIHRDIKPGNIWLESNHQGRVKLLDFGLARGTADEVHLTASGAIVGTPAYMAPEQARSEKVDHRVDLFSLGVVLYRLTTGQLPFRGDNTMSILTALALDTPKPPREINADIPPRLAELIERLLSKDREQRPKTARAVADELASIEREVSQTLVGAASVSAPVVGAASVSAPVVGAASVSAPVVGAASVSAPVASPAFLRSRLIPRLRYGLRKYVVAAALLLLLGGMTAAIVVIIRDKQGNKVGEFPVPPGGSVTVEDKGKDQAKKPAAKVEVRIEPEPLAPLEPGEPLSYLALVRHPAKLAGLRSWTIATRETWTPSTIAYRPDGKRLAVGTWDGTVRIWEAKTGRLLRVILSHGTVASLAWSPDGRVLAVGSGLLQRCVHLWDAGTGRLLRELETSIPDFIFALAWSPDGRQIRAWGASQHCWTWEAATGKRLHARSIPCSSQRPHFSPDAQRLASILDGNRVVTIWDTDTGKELSRLTAQADVWRLAWSPDGKRLACTGQDGLIVWDVQTRKQVFHRAKAVNRTDPPVWSPDGRSVVYNLDNYEGTEVIELAGDAEPIRLEDGGDSWIAWSPDGKTIALINGEPWIRLYDAATGKRLLTLTDGRAIFGFAWSPDDKTLALSERFGTFLASADTGQVSVELKQESWPKTQTAWPMAWSPDGKQLAAPGPDNLIQLWLTDGRILRTLADHKADVTSLAWSPDGKRLASTAKGEKRVLLWDAVKGERQGELGPFPGAVESVKWSADGRLVTFNVPEVGWHVWDIETNRLLNDPKQWKVYWAELTPDGRSALTAPTEKEVYRLRDLANGKDGARLPFAHGIYQAQPTWSSDGRMLAVCLHDGIDLWKPDLSKRLRKLSLAGGASHVTFSRDGKLVAALTGERLFVWETDTGRLRGLMILGRRNNGLTLAPQGQYTGDENVERGIVMVVEKDDGTQEMLEPADFKQKYGFKNEPGKVHLLNPKE